MLQLFANKVSKDETLKHSEKEMYYENWVLAISPSTPRQGVEGRTNI